MEICERAAKWPQILSGSTLVNYCACMFSKATNLFVVMKMCIYKNVYNWASENAVRQFLAVFYTSCLFMKAMPIIGKMILLQKGVIH